jgi:two-component system chemotaxis response regulator CheY
MLRMLVVDDSAVMRRVVVRSLQLSGLPLHEVEEARDGQEALELVRKSWIDIVLCDVHMPIMNGAELVRRMRADPLTRDLPVVIVSSDRSEGRVAELQQLGVRAYVRKPFQPEALGRIVREALGLGGAS